MFLFPRSGGHVAIVFSDIFLYIDMVANNFFKTANTNSEHPVPRKIMVRKEIRENFNKILRKIWDSFEKMWGKC